MFVSDLRNEFYNQLIGKRTLVIVNYDVDAICTSKILQFLFKYDNILYSIVPVMGLAGLKRAFLENAEDVKNVIFINCGGCIDLCNELEPSKDVVFYICDSHRPYEVNNIYSDEQVRILGDPVDGIPNFDDIFKYDDDEIEKELEGLEYENYEEFLRKRREIEQYLKNRDKIMFEYTEYSFYGQSSALRIFELAWKLSRDSIDLLWWAIVGTTEQLILSKTEHSAYALDIETIQTHVSRLTHAVNDNQIQMAVKINFENDLHLAIYRHWSILDSLKNSIYPACKLKLWTYKGEKLMHELLVDIGLPLVQAKQTFQSMDLVLRKEFHSKIEKFSEKFGLSDIVFGSFTLQYGYRNKYSASDYVYAMIALLESVKKDRTPETCFLEALDCLSRSHKNLLDDGIEKCKTMLHAIFKQAQSSIEMHQIHSAGPFLYYVLQEENPFIKCPYGLVLLAKFVLHGHLAVSRNRRAKELPMIVVTPIDTNLGFSLLAGIPPVMEENKNLLGRAFDEAKKKSNAVISADFFDTFVLQIKHTDCIKFLDALTIILS